MRLSELKQIVDEAVEYFEDEKDPEIKFASQPSWPFEYSIGDVAYGEDVENADSESIYLVEGQQLGYTTNNFW